MEQKVIDALQRIDIERPTIIQVALKKVHFDSPQDVSKLAEIRPKFKLNFIFGYNIWVITLGEKYSGGSCREKCAHRC